MPAAHFGAGAASELPGAVRGTGVPRPSSSPIRARRHAVVARVRDALATGGIRRRVFAGCSQSQHRRRGGRGRRGGRAGGGRPPGRWWRSAVGPAIDAAKGIAVAAVNPERGRDLDYRRDVRTPGPADRGGADHRGHRDGDERVRGRDRSGDAAEVLRGPRQLTAGGGDPRPGSHRRPAARGDGRHRDGRPDPRAGVLHVQAGQSVVGRHRPAGRPHDRGAPAAGRRRRRRPEARSQMLLASHLAGHRLRQHRAWHLPRHRPRARRAVRHRPRRGADHGAAGGAALQPPGLRGAPRRGGVRPRRRGHRAQPPGGTRTRRSTRSPRWRTGSG